MEAIIIKGEKMKKEVDILAKERDFLTISTVVLIITLAMFWYGVFYWRDYYNQAMNQLADYKCKEMQYEIEEIIIRPIISIDESCINKPACGGAMICPPDTSYIYVENEGFMCKKQKYKNFTIGRFLPEENKIECIKIDNQTLYDYQYYKDRKSLFDFLKTCVKCGAEGCGSCVEKSQKFTLEELGIR